MPMATPSSPALPDDPLTAEQQRLAQALHDSVCQTLAGTALLAKMLAGKLRQEGHAQAPQAEEVGKLLQQAIAEVRAVAEGLRKASPGSEQ